MLVTIIITIVAGISFNLAKSKRDLTGEVRTPQSLMFIIFAFLASILWLKQIFSSLFG